MWIATTTGFYSAVAHKHDKRLVVVRSRVLQDADALAGWVNRYRADYIGSEPGEAEVVAYRQSDYPWRVIITKQEWAQFLTFEAEGIDYTNYKDAVTKRQGRERHDIYARVWGVLLGLSKLPGAMKDHGKRAVPHPLYGASRASAHNEMDAWFASRQDSLWDRFGAAEGEDDLDDDEQPWPGDPGHEDCTDSGCEADDTEPCCA
jgi:hypothetical protein